MSAVILILILLACSCAWWLVNFKYAGKVQQPFKFLINCIILAVAFYYVLFATGLWDTIRGVKVPRV